eukprot:2700294-Lingulodinium_polyedra.AAC.1
MNLADAVHKPALGPATDEGSNDEDGMGDDVRDDAPTDNRSRLTQAIANGFAYRCLAPGASGA